MTGCGGGSSSPTAGSTTGGATTSPDASSSSHPATAGNSSSTPGSSTSPGARSKGPGAKSGGAHPRKSTASRTPPPRPTIAVSSGFKRTEKYCALTPATGTLTYTPSGGNATVQLSIGGLPPNALLAIDWQTNDGNGYSIGSFQTDASGASEQDTLRMFRSPAKAGDQVLITTANGTQVGQLNHC